MSTPTDVQSLVDGSGNSFHSRVARWFAAEGWHITVSPYYMDQSHQKAREVDLVVEKKWPIRNNWGRDTKDEVIVRLFVECKYITNYAVFWFTAKDGVAVEKMVCLSGLFPLKSMDTRHHHYLATHPRVAKLFATKGSQDNDPIYKALNQAVNALVSMRNHPARLSSNRGATFTLDFPIVVCNSFSKFYEADFDVESEPKDMKENFQLELEYAYVGASGVSYNELFIIDFIEYDKLSELVSAVERDASAFAIIRAATSEN